MSRLIHILLLFVSITANSQNLVPNWSFEDTIGCPYNLPFNNYTTFWFTTNSSSTPDYYHECSSTFNVPNTGYGLQNARTGKAYIGIFTFDKANYNGHEFIQVPLVDTLEKDKCYELSFYVNLLDNMEYACNNIGAYFSETSVTSASWIPPLTPQIINNPSTNPLTNKEEWILVSGKYIATGGEKFITIGNFVDDSVTDTVFIGPPSGLSIAYYLIDDVSLIRCSENTITIPNVFTPNGDGINDLFLIESTGIESVYCEIFDRWGIKVASISRVNEGWDGRTTSGQEATEGVYYYKVIAKGIDSKEYRKTGFIQLLR